MPNTAGQSTDAQGRVSRGEEALFGEFGPAMRLLSLSLANIGDAQAELVKLLEEARRDDTIRGTGLSEEAMPELPTFFIPDGFEPSGDKVPRGHAPRDAEDRSPYTYMVERMFEQVIGQHRALRRLYQEVAADALGNTSAQHGFSVPVA